LHPVNLGRLFYDESGLVPATPAGILDILRSQRFPLSGKRIALIGFTPVVNMPLAILLGKKKASVIVLQETDPCLPELVSRADLVISAVGKRHLLRKSWLKEGTAVIDVGVTRKKGKLFGDLAPNTHDQLSWFTPVPGGVGPLTVINLFRNLVKTRKLT